MDIFQAIDKGLVFLAVLFAFLFAPDGRIALVRTYDMATSGFNVSEYSSMLSASWDISAVPNLSALGIKRRFSSRIGHFS